MTETTVGFRLSQRQRRFWRLHEESAPLCTRCVVAIDAIVEPERLREALGTVVLRHDALRTSFRAIPGVPFPLQVVAEDAAVEWRVTDGPVEAFWDEAAHRAYALDDEPPVAATLVQGEGSSHLVLGFSALAVDARSATTLVRDLARAYAGEPVDAEPAQYVQFSEWQHELLSEGDGDGPAHWRRALAAVEPLPPLPLERPDGELRPRRTLPVEVDGVSAELVLAAWATLLLRLTRSECVTVWTTLDGRTYEELEDAVGPFAQSVPLTVAVRPDSRFCDVLAQVEQASKESARRLDWLTDENGAPAPASASFESVPAEDGAAPFSLERVEVDAEPHRFALVRHGARLELRYAAERIADEDARVLAEQLRLVVAAALEDPDVPLERLPIVTRLELARMDAANDTATGTASPRPFHVLFSEQAAATPDAPASACGDEVVTYAELERRSNRVANVLRARGLGRGSICALEHEHGVDVLAGLLGILKAGAAYLPVDPRWPRERVATLLRDAAPGLLLTQEGLPSEPEPAAIPTLCLDRDAELFAAASGAPLEADNGPDDLAYVMYTSGSTGEPKGVCVTHGGLANYLTWACDAYPFESGPALVHTSIAVDLTVTAMLAPLLAGQCVRFAAPEGIEGLARALEQYDGFGVLKLTPAHLRLLRGLVPEHKAARLARAFVVGGEALLEDTLAYWRRAAPETAVFNEYGPTETVVGCCVHDASSPAEGAAVPIGRPIANTRLYVLDETGRRVPLGVPGELFVGGAGVAHGYLGRPDLTLERFVPDPFGGEPSARLYRTGDLVRYLPDGALEFIGRVDDQEQVNGLRVEPAEIEAVLAQHPRVEAAAVAVRRDAEGTARILACVVPAPAGAPEPDELRRFIRDRLPEHMVPALVSTVEALPLTASGKVDRRALPEPAPERPAEPPVRTATLTEVEERVTRIWEEALGFYGIGLDDNFFDLGGHSFLLLDVAAQLQSEFGVEVTPLQLLEHPTVGSIARLLSAGEESPAEEPLEAVEADRAQRRREALDAARAGRGEGREE